MIPDPEVTTRASAQCAAQPVEPLSTAHFWLVRRGTIARLPRCTLFLTHFPFKEELGFLLLPM
jgi:hypothetical protein